MIVCIFFFLSENSNFSSFTHISKYHVLHVQCWVKKINQRKVGGVSIAFLMDAKLFTLHGRKEPVMHLFVIWLMAHQIVELRHILYKLL